MHTVAFPWKPLAALAMLLPGASWACAEGLAEGLAVIGYLFVGGFFGLLALGSLAVNLSRGANALSRSTGRFIGWLNILMGILAAVYVLPHGVEVFLACVQVGAGVAGLVATKAQPRPA